MQVNKNIYPTTDEKETRDLTISIGEMPINTQIDDSIVYSASTSKIAPWTNYGICEGWSYNTQYLQPSEEKGSGGVIMKTCTGIQRQILIGSTVNTHQMTFHESSLYNNRQAYNVVDKLVPWNSIKPVSAFKYYTAVACIYVVTVRYENPLTFWTHDLDSYLKDHSNEKMVGAFIRIFQGTENSRNTEWYFANYDEIVLTQIGKDPSNPNEFTITNTENIINHTDFNFARVGGILCGITSIQSTSYKYSLLNSYNLGMYYNIDSYNIEKTQMYGTGNSGHMRLPVDSNIDVNTLLSMCATYGILFTTSETLAKGGLNGLDLSNESKEDRSKGLFSDDLYFPIKEDDGLWQGRWTHGLDNENTEQYKNNWNSDKNAPFENGSPHVEPDKDPNKYEDDFGLVYSSPIMGFTNKYLMSVEQLINLAKFLNNEDESKFEMILHNLEFAGTNPLNCVTSIQYMPVNIGVVNYNPVNIVLGKLTCNEEITGISGGISGTLLTNANPQVYCGWCYCPIEHENYLDYAPYTAYMMYLPFAGYVDLDADVVSGKYIQVYMNIDVYSGSCIYDIRVSGDSSNHGNRYKTVAGNVSTPISIQGTDSNAFANSLMQNLTRSFQCAGSFTNSAIDIGVNNALIETLNNVGIEDFTEFGAIKTGLEYVNRQAKSVSNAAVNAGNFLSSIYSVLATPMTFTEVGSASGNAMKNMATQVFLYRYTMVDNADDKYGEFIGYACEFSEALSNLSGFTVCANVRLDGFNATETEKNMIKAILESGFYIT